MNWSGYRIDPLLHPVDTAKCGTPANYRAHLRRGEKACAACRQAEARRKQDSGQAYPSGWAKERARRQRRASI